MNAKMYSRIVFIFQNDIKPPKAIGQFLEETNPQLWEEVKQIYPRPIIRRLFASAEPEEIDRKIDLAKKRVEGKRRKFSNPALNNFFVITCPNEVNEKKMVETLSKFKIIDDVYVEGKSAMPPSVTVSNESHSVDQSYLNSAEEGISARFAWGKPGGRGISSINFIDIEQGWNLDHEALIGANVTLIEEVQVSQEPNLLGKSNREFKKHGTNVLGVILAQENSHDCVGITPAVTAHVISEWRFESGIDENGDRAGENEWGMNTADAILQAVNSLNEGDVILIEAQKGIEIQTENETQTVCFPVDVDRACRVAIRFGVDLGIIIIEAGGDGKTDLDESRRPALNRNHANFKDFDSGAIMVGACTPGVPHRRREGAAGSNFGSRIDCYAWGSDIGTTSTNDGGTTSSYISDFSETSGASAILAGAVMSIQSMRVKARKQKFTPGEMRFILREAECGTPSSNPESDKIGLMPDLRKIFERYIEGGHIPGTDD